MIERRNFLKILGLAGLFPAAVGKQAIAEPPRPKPAKAPKPARVKRQRKTKAVPFPDCEVREISFKREQIPWDSIDGTRGYRAGLETVEWEVWVNPYSRAGRMVVSLKPNEPVILRHHDKRTQATYKGQACLESYQSMQWPQCHVIVAKFVGTDAIEATYGGRPVSPRGVIRFA